MGQAVLQSGYVEVIFSLVWTRIDSLQRFADPNIPRIQDRAERLPLKNGSVGIVVAISLVEHISDQGAFFQELARVLEPEGGGRLAVSRTEIPH